MIIRNAKNGKLTAFFILTMMLILFVGIGLAYRSNSYTLWFCPLPYNGSNFNGSFDYYDLFSSRIGQWSNVRSHIEVFKFYDACFNPNEFSDDQVKNIIARLKEWNISLALESGAVKDWSCDAVAAANSTIDKINRIESLGGSVKYVCMDEPVWAGINLCKIPFIDNITDSVVYYKYKVNAAHPEVIVGTIEAYPSISVDYIKYFIQGLKTERVKNCPFFTWMSIITS